MWAYLYFTTTPWYDGNDDDDDDDDDDDGNDWLIFTATFVHMVG